ncbi:MAG: hypothetical protein M3Y82_06295 [Verrucomicrobiota bacterium]|nr:hypothetical protein [Verrucomicrobiota bacterium]
MKLITHFRLLTSRPLLLTIIGLPSLFTHVNSVRSQGQLAPTAPPGPTMKTLAQIEPRTPISSVSFTITNSGSYYLTTNLNVLTGNAITIATNGVTLDLNGFTISSTAASANGTGILINSSLRNLTIQNGFIQGGVTNNGTNVYSGGGFQYGIHQQGSSPVNVVVSRVSVAGLLGNGINLGTGNSTVVESCTAHTVGGNGIIASTIQNCAAVDCGATAIFGDVVSNSHGESTGLGYGLTASFNANNCYGSSSGTGLFAANTANNCSGYCSGNNTGLSCTHIAIGCYGFSSSGIGLSAYIANSCRGQSTFGIAQSINFKYSMP